MTQLSLDLRRRRVLSLGGGLDSFALLVEWRTPTSMFGDGFRLARTRRSP